MNESELDAELASANPIDNQTLRTMIPPVVSDAMLREITNAGRTTRWQRITSPVLDGLGPARVGFVGVLAVVALIVFTFGAVSIGGSRDDQIAEPAGAGVAQESTVEVSSIAQTTVVTVTTEPEPSSSSSLAPAASAVPSTSATVAGDGPSSTQSSESSNSTTTTPPTTPSSAVAGPCVATGGSLTAAMSAYEQTCTTPRVDCDPVGGVWTCSSEQLGSEAPTGVPVEGQEPTAPTVASSCLTIEAEALQLVGAWSRRADDSASGGEYIVWEGLSKELNNAAATDIISATFDITAPGTYRFVWAMRQPGGVAGHTANDSWLNFPDADRFGPVTGGSYGGFVKVFGNSAIDFAWTAKGDQYEVKSDVAVEFASVGSYTVQIGGRSHGHQIDKLLIYGDSISRDDAISGRCP